MLDTKTRGAVVVALCFFLSSTLVYAKALSCSTAATKQECCSETDCNGKVLSNVNKDNCRKDSKGKSWHKASDGTTAAQCGNL
jgi:hypothetical protein